MSQEELKRLTCEADLVFESIGLSCKAWTYSGEPPPSVVAMDGGSVKLAGLRWLPEVDAVEMSDIEMGCKDSTR